MGAGLDKSKVDQYSYTGCQWPETDELVRGEVHQGQTSTGPSREEISLDVSGGDVALRRGLRYTYGFRTSIDSPSECTTLSTLSNVTSTPLDHKYRYHLFFAYNFKDEPWVESVVRRLEQEPLNFRCCYGARDFDRKISDVQNILCSIMLSQRVVVVLTPSFIQESWTVYEETITHLTSLSQRRQRVLPVVLEECVIPESLRVAQPVDVSQDAFLDGLYQSLAAGSLSTCQSLSTIRSGSIPQAVSFKNGQVLAHVTAKVHGRLRSSLKFDYEEVMDSLSSPEIGMSHEEFVDIITFIGGQRHMRRLSWLFSAVPIILLCVLFFLWCVSFILVILLLPDRTPFTLPVRLCVFTFPGAMIVLGCVFRWRKVHHKRDKLSLTMFSRSIQINATLYERGQPLMISTARSKQDTFNIYFVYFNRCECIEQIKLSLTHCSDEDNLKLNRLVDVYTLNGRYLEGCPIAVRVAVMMSAAYAINLVYKRVPHAMETRHTRRRQCLCQFVEEFLTAYLPCVRQESDVTNLCHVFFKYLNCQLRPDPITLHTLGIVTAEKV